MVHTLVNAIGSVDLIYRFKTTIYCMSTRNRTYSQIIGCGVYSYFLKLSFKSPLNHYHS